MKRLSGLLILCVCTLVSSSVLSQEASLSTLPPGVATTKIKWETFTALDISSTGSLSSAPDSNPNRLPLPTQSTSTTFVRKQLYVYSMDLSNNGPKPIKALAWDFIFIDPINKAELLRHSLANVQKIDPKQKKTVGFTTQLPPPKTVSATALEKDKSSPFNQTVAIKCVMFTDGSIWEQPNAEGKPCESLRRWLERRKKWRPGIEDLPVTP